MRLLLKKYLYINDCIDGYYRKSNTYRLTHNISDKIGTFFTYSFLGRFSQINKEKETEAMKNSRVIRWLLDLSTIVNNSLYSNSAKEVAFIKNIMIEFYNFPVRITGIVVLSMVIINILCAFFLKIEISLSGWTIRGALFLVGISGIACNVDWPTLKSNSIILKLTERKIE